MHLSIESIICFSRTNYKGVSPCECEKLVNHDSYCYKKGTADTHYDKCKKCGSDEECPGSSCVPDLNVCLDCLLSSSVKGFQACGANQDFQVECAGNCSYSPRYDEDGNNIRWKQCNDDDDCAIILNETYFDSNCGCISGFCTFSWITSPENRDLCSIGRHHPPPRNQINECPGPQTSQ